MVLSQVFAVVQEKEVTNFMRNSLAIISANPVFILTATNFYADCTIDVLIKETLLTVQEYTKICIK